MRRSSLQKKMSWKHDDRFFVAGRSFYCDSEKVFANRWVVDHAHGDGKPQNTLEKATVPASPTAAMPPRLQPRTPAATLPRRGKHRD